MCQHEKQYGTAIFLNINPNEMIDTAVTMADEQ
jgi:hypothetical protein